MERRLFTPDDKIAPGLYMQYWQAIVKKYGANQLNINKLKAYREVRNGAILAGLWTKVTGKQHFVSFPYDEPADVEVYSLESIEFKGKPAFQLQRVPVQLTRCLLSEGETIIGQIKKKNKPALSDTTLVVHLIGEDNAVIELNDIVKDVRQLEIIHPREIVLLAPLEDSNTRGQVFGQLLLYSRDDDQVRSSRVSVEDKEAFFNEPQIMHSQRGTGQAIELSGTFSLMLP